MKQLVGFTSKGNKVTIVDFVVKSGDTFAVCLHQFGGFIEIPILNLNNVHYEIV